MMPATAAPTIACFGEILLRLGVNCGERLDDARALGVVVGGAEANVAVGMASLGWQARMISAVPANALGTRALAALAGAGVDVAPVVRAPGRMGLYFLEPGACLRASQVVYDRAGSAFAGAGAALFDFDRALAGVKLLHLSGITAALGPGGLALSLAAIAAARAAGAVISFDPNYRDLLWSAWDSDPRGALTQLVGEADILFANHRDMTLLLGQPFAGDGAQRRSAAAQAAFAAFPRLQAMASTARTVLSQTHHRLSARVDTRTGSHQTDAIDVTDIIDRIGTGDAFATGVLHTWLHGGSAAAMASAGLAASAYKHGIHGDWCRLTPAAIAAVPANGNDVAR